MERGTSLAALRKEIAMLKREMTRTSDPRDAWEIRTLLRDAKREYAQHRRAYRETVEMFAVSEEEFN